MSPEEPRAPVEPRTRGVAIDALRGVVMVLMALDHTRDFWGGFTMSLTNAATTTLPRFFTRWVTHFCAPVFVLLAGVGAFLYGHRGRTRRDVSWFLLTRGLWLVLLELTVIRFGWTFDPTYTFTMLQVIWAIGWSMAALAGLVWLPDWMIAVVAAVMIGGHNALDSIHRTRFAHAPFVWSVVHESAPFRWGHANIYVAYPLVPWIGVMAAGYLLGRWAVLTDLARRRRYVVAGVVITLGFVALRLVNRYGDPDPWRTQATTWRTVLSFLDCEKYPPSLAYLCMTLGPSLLLLGLIDGRGGAVMRFFATFGRVPLFYYVAHLYLLHLGSLALVSARLGWSNPVRVLRASWGAGFGLPAVYAVWAVALVALYPACRWYGRRKAAGKSRWWSYV